MRDLLVRLYHLETMPKGMQCHTCIYKLTCMDDSIATCDKYKEGTLFVPKPIRALITAGTEWFHTDCECWKTEVTCRRCAIFSFCRVIDDCLRLAAKAAQQTEQLL